MNAVWDWWQKLSWSHALSVVLMVCCIAIWVIALFTAVKEEEADGQRKPPKNTQG